MRCPRGGRPSSGTSLSCRPPGGPGTPSVDARSSPGCGSSSRPARGWHPSTTSGSPPAAAGSEPVDPDVFVDTSSYGAQGLDALTRALGIDSIVLGSDRPVRRASPVAARRGRDPGRAGRQPASGARWAPAPRSRDRSRTWRPWHERHRSRRTGPRGDAPGGRPDPRHAAGPRPRPGRAALARLLPGPAARAVAAPSRVRRRPPRLRLALPRCPRRRLAAVLDPRERHRLPRPRHLVRSRCRGQRHVARAQPRDRQPDHRDPGRGRPRLQLRPRPHPPAHRRRPRVGVGARLQPAAVADGPVLRRRRRPAPPAVSVSYADELRPID